MKGFARWTALSLLLAACGHDGDAATTDGPSRTDGAAGPGGDGSVPSADAGPADAAIEYACAPTPTAGHQEIDCPEGVHMDVEVSDACATGGCGMLFDVHGFTMTADQLDTHTRMRLLAPPLGYVVIQPTAPGLWADGEHYDVVWDFAVATMDRLRTDPDRLHFMGFSQGAGLSFDMLCAHADAVASIAPAAGSTCFSAGSRPAVERPILYMSGTADVINLWALYGLPVRDAILATGDFGPATPIGAGTGYQATRWTTSSGTAFEFWQHDYEAGDLLAGHCLPVPDGTGPYRCADPEFDYSQQALRFFAAHPRGH